MPNKHYSKIKDDIERRSAEQLAEEAGVPDLTTNDINDLLMRNYPETPDEQREEIMRNRERRGK
ncbi:hypothetical protein [Xanthomonas sacchari]|uniref:hypothetical protein n=1 Tax=Xanthomonas sacchari TaxID=56458 RepID=UPI00225DDA7A|nr:hypothetical protein [Xanthomonas sacchari]